jgi:hypothetical protein
LRFLVEGENQWVWGAYQAVYRGKKTVRDYPRLQLFDALKVPGFAAILDRYVRDFPRSVIVYVVRDPRDVLAATYKRWRVANREALRKVPWCSEDWLGLPGDDPVVRLALRWRGYMEASRRVPGVIYVRYEDFCADKVRFICELGARVGTPVDEARIRGLADEQASPASVRPYRPEGPGAWTRGYVSDRDATLIRDLCGDYMEQWQYV